MALPRPVAVLISDVHYNIHTLPLADAAMRQAIDKANSLGVDLIVTGDIHDSKANIRGECVNTMIETFKQYQVKGVRPMVLRGNHDALNEKSKEHSLGFFQKLAYVVTEPDWQEGLYLFPYEHDNVVLKKQLKEIPKGSIVIMHQGLTGSNMGDYIQDKSAITKEDVAGFRVISGHYHTRQTIDLPNGGKWDYIGNPYTLGFGEANDPEKGFQILYNDGSLEFIPTNLRKHVIIKADLSKDTEEWSSGPIRAGGGVNDIVWVKFKGTREQISRLNRIEWLKEKGIPQNSKITYEYTDQDIRQVKSGGNISQPELLDSIIDNIEGTEEYKQRLKKKWRDL